jgi:hypothetical protein
MTKTKKGLVRLKNLLLATQPGEFDCQADLRAFLISGADVAYTSTSRTDRSDLIRIYSVRMKGEEERRAKGLALIEGLESTLAALKRADESELVVHALDYPSFAFTVFTDPEISRVVGVLRSKIRTRS